MKCAAGLALLWSAAGASAQPDITGPAVVVPASAQSTPAGEPAAAKAAPAEAAPGEAEEEPRGGGEAVPGVAGPIDPPPVSQLFPAAGGEEAPPDMTQNVTINLLKIFVQKGYLSQTEALGLIRQAESEAEGARRASQEKKAAEAAEEDEALKVSYVPEAVRQQMREEIRGQVMADLKAGSPDGKNSAVALALPGMDESFGLFGDIRLRYELQSFPEGNDNTGAFPNFNAINTGAPFDTAGLVFSPQRNVDQERTRFRYRVRVGGEWQLSDGFSTGIRVATGENNSPVTTNQSVGLANQGQGGNFSKYALWLDRAFFKYHADFSRGANLDLLGGRFDSPFMATPILFDEDLGFDGLAVKFKGQLGPRVKPFLTAGAFPIFNTDLNFSSNQAAKFESTDKYLLAAQGGADFKLSDEVKLKLGIAYYNFDGVQGELSEPFLPLSASDAGPTDNTRPSFAQSGNTYKPLRQIIPDATNNFGTSNQYQYFGLASEFAPVVVSGKLEYSGFEPVQVAVNGEYIKNTAFNRAEIDSVAVNNRGAVPAGGAPGGIGVFDGDDSAWMVSIKFGQLALMKKGDWTLGAEYRYIGSDAVVDGFIDSDFGSGGSNSKGFAFTGAYALTKNASLGVLWNSNEEIAGPPLKADFLMVDFKIKF